MFDARIWKRSVFSGPAAMLVLALFQSLFVLSALLQSTWVYYRVYAAGPDQGWYYHTVREPIALQLLGMLLVLMAAELLLWWCFGRLSVTATPVLVPLFVLLTLSTVYQTYARSPANAVKHFATILLGLGAMVASMVLVQLLARIRLSGPAFRWMLYGCWALCLLSLLAGLISRGGAFLDLGFLNIQPGEFFKLLTIFLIGAGFVHTLQDRRTSCLLLLTLLFLVLTLVLVGDLGNAFILFLAALLVIFFRYGARAAGALAAAAALGSAVSYRILSAFLPADNRILWRVSNTFQALTVPLEGRVNRDLRTALFAALRGGVFGSGLAHNTYVLNNAYRYTDFIFDIVLCFFGAAMALLAVLAVILLILRSRTDLEHTGQNLSHYIYSNLMVLVIATQAIVHVGGNLNVLPFTGVTFPFLSAGGSAMIASFMELGLALGGRVEGSCLAPLAAPAQRGAAALGRLLEPVCTPVDRWVLHRLAWAQARLPQPRQLFRRHRRKGGSEHVSSQ